MPSTVKTIPYGTEFVNIQQVADFLVSYERYLTTQGFAFNYFDKDLEQNRDWKLSIQEFLYWSQQGWDTNAIINLNPLASSLEVTRDLAVVDSIQTETTENLLLDQNSKQLRKK